MPNQTPKQPLSESVYHLSRQEWHLSLLRNIIICKVVGRRWAGLGNPWAGWESLWFWKETGGEPGT